MPDYILRSTVDFVTTLRLNRPEKRNALNAGMVREIHDAVRAAARDEGTRVLVLEGTGSAFCAGADLSYLKEINENSTLENTADSQALMEMMHAIRTFPKPTIAKLNGHAIAGGCGLALTCDIVTAATDARLGFTEVRIGFVPAIVMKLLVERTGVGRARELLLRGNLVTAQEALTLGMVNHVVAGDKLSPFTESLAAELASDCSPQAVRLTKQLFDEILPLDLRAAMERGVAFNAISRTSEDFKTGVQSFLEKKKPEW